MFKDRDQMQVGTEKPHTRWNSRPVNMPELRDGPFTDRNAEEVNYDKKQGSRVSHDLWSRNNVS
jgi:hypothetical protein